MEFPPPWSFFPMEDFELAAPRDPGDIGVEAMAQARANGRVLDHFRIVLGGSQMLEATVAVKDIFPVAAMPSWSVAFSCWPRDVAIRRNMASSAWQDIRDMVAANNVKLLNGEGANMATSSLICWIPWPTRPSTPPPSGVGSGPAWMAACSSSFRQLRVLPADTSANLPGKGELNI